jgi:PTH2 family peptidyl-tRNA hydrolase
VLQVKDISEMYELKMDAEAAGLPASLITDAGLTEIPPGTVTALGISDIPHVFLQKDLFLQMVDSGY